MFKRKLPCLNLENNYICKLSYRYFISLKGNAEYFCYTSVPFGVCLYNIFIVKEGMCLVFKCGKNGE